MSEETTVDLPSESETNQVIANPEPSAIEEESEESNEVETQILTKEQKKILELKAQKKSLTEQKYRERQEKEALLAELEMLRNNNRSQEQVGIDDIVEQRVQERIQAREHQARDAEFNKACNATWEAGKQEFPDFDNKIQSLGSIGIDRDTLEYIATTDNGARILNYLGDDLEEADRIMKLPALKKAEALIKIKNSVDTLYKKKVSNTPAPIPPVGGKTSNAAVGDIAHDYDAFNRWFNSGLQKGR
jgi:hypothetical protein